MQNDQIGRDITFAQQRLGPQPEAALRAFVDLGLDDWEIGRYHAVSPTAVCALRKQYRIPTAAVSNTANPMNCEIDNDVYLAGILRTNADDNSLRHPRVGGEPDSVQKSLRQFALAVRSKLFD